MLARLAILVWMLWLGVSLSSAAEPTPGEWPQFLGPQRNGVSAERGLIDEWPRKGLSVVWRATAGVGTSGIAVSRGRAVTLWQDEDEQFVVALDALSGRVIWKTSIASAFRNSTGNGPRSTPTIDGDHVYAFTGDGVLAALSFTDGRILWHHDVLDELHGTRAEYGMAGCPLVAGSLVVIIAGAPGGTVVAYEREGGKLAWKYGRDSAGYSSPVLLNLAGAEQVVCFTGDSLLGLTPQSGALLWRYPFPTEYDCNIATPIPVQGGVLISAGESHGSALLKVESAPTGMQVREVWTSLGSKSVLRNEYQTTVLVGDYLYGFDNVGSAGPVTDLVCVEAATGKRVWSEPRFGKGNLIAVDGKLIIVTMIGEVVLVRADPSDYVEMGREALMGSLRQAPALANGLLYIRDNFEVLCLDLRKR